jgi:hypothetical protein
MAYELNNIAIFNDQPLDSEHDIIVSFDYAMYNYYNNPLGGFAIVLYDSINDLPRGGGPRYSLGYCPSSDIKPCNVNGFTGILGAYFGIGFDPQGKFSLSTSLVNGLTSTYENSIGLRAGVLNDYSLLFNTTNLKSWNNSLSSFNIAENLGFNEEVIYKTVRIILKHAGTKLIVQLKNNKNDENYITAFEYNFPEIQRRSFKVAITRCKDNDQDTTVFDLKNFNVAGYPGAPSDITLNECYQNLEVGDYSGYNFLPVGTEWIAVPGEKEVKIYSTDTERYSLEQTLRSSNGIKVLGSDKDTILMSYLDKCSILIYNYLGTKFARTYSFNLPVSGQIVGGDINDDIIAVTLNLQSISSITYIYKLNTLSAPLSSLGEWQLFQTITSDLVPSGVGMGISCQIDKDYLLMGNINQYVHSFKFNEYTGYQPHQTIFSPMSGITRFGYSLAREGNDLIIGAPYSSKIGYYEPGQGEAYHYFLYSATNQWGPVMALGYFYDIFTPAGNFGNSVSLNDNVCVIGSPGEMWKNENKSFEDIPNVGRTYIFKKTTGGYFTQATVLYPISTDLEKYMFFGQAVGNFKTTAACLAPYTVLDNKCKLQIFNVNCTYPAPPARIPIPISPVSLFDYSGFIISTQNNTYLVTLSSNHE